MILSTCRELDKWIVDENKLLATHSSPEIANVQLKLIGQTALLEAKLSITLVATMDVDVYGQLESRVREKFAELLEKEGRHLDPVGHEAWMPDETIFQLHYDGNSLQSFIAEPVFIILSKAKMASEKNKNLIVDYLASEDCDQRIFSLAEKYQVELSEFV